MGVVKAGAPALVTAFATDSSSAALPVTRRCARAMVRRCRLNLSNPS